MSAASCFLTARAMEQIKLDLAYSSRHVVLCAQSPGVGYGELGPTHQSIEDIAWLRAIDHMTIIVPADPVETAAALRWAAAYDGPVCLRVSRMAVPAIHDESYEFVPGRSVTVRDGRDITLAANGTVLWRTWAAVDLLAADGIEAGVLSMASVKPRDVTAIVTAAIETGGIVTVEESLATGGLGGAVAETVVAEHPVPIGHARLPRLLRHGLVGLPHRQGRHDARGDRRVCQGSRRAQAPPPRLDVEGDRTPRM